jgi:hypothetical protein
MVRTDSFLGLHGLTCMTRVRFPPVTWFFVSGAVFRPILWFIQCCIQWMSESLSTGIKQPEREAEHSFINTHCRVKFTLLTLLTFIRDAPSSDFSRDTSYPYLIRLFFVFFRPFKQTPDSTAVSKNLVSRTCSEQVDRDVRLSLHYSVTAIPTILAALRTV